MAPISYSCLIVLLAVNAAASSCKGKCYPGKMHQGKLGIAIGNEFDKMGQRSSLSVFKYYAYDKEGEIFYGRGFDAGENGATSLVEVLQLNLQVTTFMCSAYG